MNLFFVLFIFFPFFSHARVFSLNDETVASYFKGTYGPSAVLQTPFSGTSGADTTVAQTFSTNLGGEVGVIFTANQAAFSLGIAIIHPKALSHVDGVDASSEVLYNLDADVSAIIPKVGFDFVLKRSEHWRIIFNLSGGAGTLSYTNHYAFTTAGQTAFSNMADFTEEGTGTATLMEGTLGFEHLLSDSTTLVLELGYRKFDFPLITYKTSVSSFTGDHLKGEDVFNADATPKKVDLGGSFAALTFRFYLGK